MGRKRLPRSKHKGYEVIVVPTIRPTRHWYLSTTLLRLLGVAMVLLIIALVAFTHHYRDILADINEIYNLRVLSHQQEARLRELNRLTEELATRLRYLEVTDERIRSFLREENLLPADVQSGSLQEQPVERLWSVQTGAQALGTTNIKDFHELSALVSSMYQRSAQTERSLEQLYGLVTGAADYFRARPAIWPVIGRVTSQYGLRRSPITGVYAFHHGIDIAGDYGTEIRATGDAAVEFSGYNGLLGRCVILDHGYGIKTLYAHNWRNLVSIGDWVERGDTIALVGSSGSSTGPHVHYEIWVDGERVDPWAYHLSAGQGD